MRRVLMSAIPLCVLALMILCPLTPLAAVPANGLVRGSVVDMEGRVVPYAQIRLTDRSEAGARQELQSIADARGRFRASVPPGKWEIRAHAEGYYQAAVDQKQAGMWYVQVYPEVTLGAGGHSDATIEMFRCSFLEGRVLGPGGQPVANRPVRLIVPRPEMFVGRIDARTDARGLFRVGLDYDGDDEFGLLCPGAGYAPVKPVQLESGKTLKLTYRLQPLACVDGVLVRANGEPAAGIAVTLQGGWPFLSHFEDRPFGNTAESVAVASGQVRSDHNGRFRFEALPGGKYTLSPPGTAFEVKVTLRDGEQRSGILRYGFKSK